MCPYRSCLQSCRIATLFASPSHSFSLHQPTPYSISYELRDSTYVIPKVVDQGYLQIGKKRMNFARREQ